MEDTGSCAPSSGASKWELAAVKALAVLAALNAAMLLLQLFSPNSYAYILGLRTPMPAAKALFSAGALLCIWCAAGLWSRKEGARKAFAVLWVFEIADGLIGLIGWPPSAGPFMEVYGASSPRGRLIWVGGTALIYAVYFFVLRFLVSRKRLFS